MAGHLSLPLSSYPPPSTVLSKLPADHNKTDDYRWYASRRFTMDPTEKRVRFADTLPRTPSPTFSSTSFGSPPGPSTPPQLYPIYLPPVTFQPAEYPPWQPHMLTMTAAHSPQTYRHLYPAYGSATAPADSGGDLIIDPLLVAPHHPAHPPPLRWDLAEHPNAIQLGSVGSPRARELSHQDLASCAVQTNVKGSPVFLRRVLLVFPGLPLQVEITPIDSPVWSATPLPYLTVGDLLYNLYKALRLSVGRDELERLERVHQESVGHAFKKRLRSEPANYDRNARYGVRYIDYLGGLRQFLGLRPVVGSELPSGRRWEEVLVVRLAPVR